MDGWENFDPSIIIGNDRVDRGLLEHDLGNPDFIRVFSMAPWQVAFMFGIPTS